MPKLPRPPPAALLAERITPDLVTLAAGTQVWRIYPCGGKYPTSWNAFRYAGPLRSSRFDHQPVAAGMGPHAQGILYGAADAVTCLAEVFQHTRNVNRRHKRRWLVGFELKKDVTLLNLTGTWPTRAGGSMAIHSGPRPSARAWSRAIYAAYPQVMGLLYCSSMDAFRPAYALYERTVTAMPTKPVFHRGLDDPLLEGRLEAAADKLGYGLI